MERPRITRVNTVGCYGYDQHGRAAATFGAMETEPCAGCQRLIASGWMVRAGDGMDRYCSDCYEIAPGGATSNPSLPKSE
jgi:hypothetical protein